MPLTSEQMERELAQLARAVRELAERVTHLQKRVDVLEQTLSEEGAAEKEPEE
jgi:prefoldin subunit 5